MQRVCYHFFQLGGCGYGATCRFSHDPADLSRLPYPVRGAGAFGGPARPRYLCYFFFGAGFCRDGDRCPHSHALADFDSEFRYGLANRDLSGLETLFILSDPEYVFVSSSLVKEHNGQRWAKS